MLVNGLIGVLNNKKEPVGTPGASCTSYLGAHSRAKGILSARSVQQSCNVATNLRQRMSFLQHRTSPGYLSRACPCGSRHFQSEHSIMSDMEMIDALLDTFHGRF